MSILVALQTSGLAATDTDACTLAELAALTVAAVTPETGTLAEVHGLTVAASHPDALVVAEAFLGDIRTAQAELMVAGDAQTLNASLVISESGTLTEADNAQTQTGAIGDTDSAIAAEVEALLASVADSESISLGEVANAMQFGPPVPSEPVWTGTVILQAQRRRKREYADAMAVALWETWMEP